MSGKKWKGKGFCKAKHIDKANEFHNVPVYGKRDFCGQCKCEVAGCKKQWALSNINGNRCSDHLDRITRVSYGDYY